MENQKPILPHRQPQEGRGGGNIEVDAMISQLKRNQYRKERTSQESVVTLSNGAKALKVRKRKRRSKQPHKEREKNKKRFFWGVLIIGGGLFVCVIIGVLSILALYNGKSFYNKTQRELQASCGASDLKIDHIRVTPVSINAQRIAAKWGTHSFLQSIDIGDISGDLSLSSFLSKHWEGEEIRAKKATLLFGNPKTSQTPRNQWSALSYKFPLYKIEKTDVFFGMKSMHAPRVMGGQGSLHLPKDKAPFILFEGGKLEGMGLPAMEVTSGLGVLNKDNMELDVRLSSANRAMSIGQLQVLGTIPSGSIDVLSFRVKADKMPIEFFLGEGLGRVLQGNMSASLGEFSCNIGRQKPENMALELPFESKGLRLYDLPFLTYLRSFSGDSRYVHPIFSEATGTISWSTSKITMHHLYLESPRFLKIKGFITVEDNQLKGKLNVGLPLHLFTKERPIPACFSKPRDGFVFISLHLSGDVHAPQDDFEKQMKTQ